MYCNKCGKEIPNNSMFCNFCGLRIEHLSQDLKLSEDELIINACKDCIQKHLKSPLTAQYHLIEIKDRDPYGRIYLYAEVDSQNGFGALIRNKLRIVLQSVDDEGNYEALNEAVYVVNFINTEDVVKRVNKWNKKK